MSILLLPTTYQIYLTTLFAILFSTCAEYLTRTRKLWVRITMICLCVLFFLEVLFLKSRTGILAIIIGGGFAFFPLLKNKFSKKTLCIGGLVVLLCLLLILYLINPDSVKGRLLVYNVLINAIADHPLQGYGWNAMNTQYMFHQAEYFALHPDSQFAMLADNVYYPYNEFLGCAYRYGLIVLFGIAILIGIIFKKSNRLLRAMISSFLVMCTFSYPISAINIQKTEAEGLYATAADWNLSGQYEASNRMLSACKKLLNTYDTELLSAENALQQSYYEQAIPHLEMAHLMIPNRFYPLYGLMLCYQHTDKQKAIEIATEILHKEIKIPSSDIDMIRDEATQYIVCHTK